MPPEENAEDVHISSAIVTEQAKEFDIDHFDAMETEVLGTLQEDKNIKLKGFVVDSLGPVNAVESMEEDGDSNVTGELVS